jgi:hypothetical protein
MSWVLAALRMVIGENGRRSYRQGFDWTDVLSLRARLPEARELIEAVDLRVGLLSKSVNGSP